jgi:hypothetical protein
MQKKQNRISVIDCVLIAIVLVYGTAYLIDWMCGGCLR